MNFSNMRFKITIATLEPLKPMTYKQVSFSVSKRPIKFVLLFINVSSKIGF